MSDETPPPALRLVPDAPDAAEAPSVVWRCTRGRDRPEATPDPADVVNDIRNQNGIPPRDHQVVKAIQMPEPTPLPTLITELQERLSWLPSDERPAAERRVGGEDPADDDVVADPRYGAVLDAVKAANTALDLVRYLIEHPDATGPEGSA